jgi:hypothetical protein
MLWHAPSHSLNLDPLGAFMGIRLHVTGLGSLGPIFYAPAPFWCVLRGISDDS